MICKTPFSALVIGKKVKKFCTGFPPSKQFYFTVSWMKQVCEGAILRFRASITIPTRRCFINSFYLSVFFSLPNHRGSLELRRELSTAVDALHPHDCVDSRPNFAA